MDCISCHNRVSHNFKNPAESMDNYMARKIIDPAIPDIHTKGVEVLSKPYENQEMGLAAIAGLENYYKTYHTDFYNENTQLVNSAITQIQAIYKEIVFIEQKINWETHPNNLGHMNSPGCFRCHDGQHLDINQQAIRLECNLCHSIPTVAGKQDFVATIEISRGPEPESHRNANWISLHNQVFNETCANCHMTADAGGTSNTSFCSNSACHGSVFTYAGFDAPKLREILQAQLPAEPVEEPPAPISEALSYTANIKSLFDAKCAVCHGKVASSGLNVTTYADLMKGGDNGAVIIAGDPDNSKLVQVQSKQHFANFSTEELEFVKQWIESGAPEN
jgi:mono/diheme cytochrome c family protein